MSKNDIVEVTVGHKVGSWFRIESRVKQVYVLSIFILIVFKDFVTKNTAKDMESMEPSGK